MLVCPPAGLPEGVDPSFLAALPENIRQEVIAEQLLHVHVAFAVLQVLWECWFCSVSRASQDAFHQS